jgi:hypothetical protein
MSGLSIVESFSTSIYWIESTFILEYIRVYATTNAKRCNDYYFTPGDKVPEAADSEYTRVTLRWFSSMGINKTTSTDREIYQFNATGLNYFHIISHTPRDHGLSLREYRFLPAAS